MQVKQVFFVSACLMALFGCAPADKAANPNTPTKSTNCLEPEYSQMDFWVGDWALSWTTPDGKTGSGSNLITKQPFGNCVVTENFDGSPTIALKGLSVSTYHKPVKKWRQTWVDDTGGYFSLHGGPQDDGTFLLDMDRLNNQGPYRRMVWKNISDNALDWHWQGKNTVEEEWGDLWIIHYTRK